jgi:hypothetical protein
VHVTVVAAAHTPALQVSPWSHLLPSLQAVPSATAGFEHEPLAELHTPTAWHWSDAAHTTGLLPAHTPAWQVSVWVQAFPSVHAVPLLLGTGAEHKPVPVWQVPGPLHWSPLVQTTGLVPVHLPDWQVSVWVQAFPSVHAVPLLLGTGAEHKPVPVWQVPGPLHWSPLVQTTGLVPVHLPDWQVSV